MKTLEATFELCAGGQCGPVPGRLRPAERRRLIRRESEHRPESDQSREETASRPPRGHAASGADTSGTESAAGSGSVLVVYYSATGNTETVAGYIAQATGGDIFEITPAQPYTDDDLNWSDSRQPGHPGARGRVPAGRGADHHRGGELGQL